MVKVKSRDEDLKSYMKVVVVCWIGREVFVCDDNNLIEVGTRRLLNTSFAFTHLPHLKLTSGRVHTLSSIATPPCHLIPEAIHLDSLSCCSQSAGSSGSGVENRSHDRGVYLWDPASMLHPLGTSHVRPQLNPPRVIDDGLYAS
jgi:hypothetical protein